MKFAVCPSCEGSGASSAYLGAFTADDMLEAGDDFRDDYMRGAYDRPCTECKGRNVVPVCNVAGCSAPVAFVEGYFGNHQGTGCWDHDADAQGAAEDAQMSAAERAFGC